MQPPVHLCLRVREDLLPRFCLLTGGGFTVGSCSLLTLASGYPPFQKK